MRKILTSPFRWWWRHFRRAYNCEQYWPWHRKWWTTIGEADRLYREQHGLSWPWQKAFWLDPHFLRAYSVVFLMLGANVFFVGLALLVVLVHVLVQAVVG